MRGVAVGAGGLTSAPLGRVGEKVASTWAPPRVQLKAAHLERKRVVSFSMSGTDHVPFNVLRTRVRAMMAEKRWKVLGVTSPTPGCGKTVVGLNLAISLSRGGDLRVVLVDLDLKRPAVASTLGAKPTGTVAGFLRGETDAADCFVEVSPSLVIGLNGGNVPESSELIQSPRMAELLAFIHSALSPDIVLLDLPPMGLGDDVLALLPQLDSTLLVVAAGQTTIEEADECERQISQNGNLLGVVLNKSETGGGERYYY